MRLLAPFKRDDRCAKQNTRGSAAGDVHAVIAPLRFACEEERVGSAQALWPRRRLVPASLDSSLPGRHGPEQRKILMTAPLAPASDAFVPQLPTESVSLAPVAGPVWRRVVCVCVTLCTPWSRELRAGACVWSSSSVCRPWLHRHPLLPLRRCLHPSLKPPRRTQWLRR